MQMAKYLAKPNRSLHFMSLIFLFTFFLHINAAYSNDRTPELEEQLYFQYQNELLRDGRGAPSLDLVQKTYCNNNHDACLSNIEIAIQALDEAANYKRNWPHVINEIYRIKKFSENLSEQLQLYRILIGRTENTDKVWKLELLMATQNSLANSNISTKSVRILQTSHEYFRTADWNMVYEKINKMNLVNPAPVASPQALIDLVNIEPKLDQYKSGLYKNKPRIYMFCRSIRTYTCLMIMKDSDGKLRTLADGSLWSQPSLGYSRHRKEYNESNGNTPAGVLRIDSAMPNNDQQLVFGKYRRLILNFVAASTDEMDYKFLLPESSQQETWWQEAVISRDIGRGLLRIHGTGVKSSKGANYYPLVPTSGCIAKRENTYDGEIFIDQRELLDELMKASNLAPINENEEKIRGLIYVVNIDDQKKNVSLDDLYKYNIVRK